jgi:lipopolysaccharide/colanic/teichoic acid biosynthesis glycosyltransferase
VSSPDKGDGPTASGSNGTASPASSPTPADEKVIVAAPPSDPNRPAAPGVVGAVRRPPRVGTKTLVGQAPPDVKPPEAKAETPLEAKAETPPLGPIVPRRRTPVAGTPIPKVTPAAGTPSTPPRPDVSSSPRSVPPASPRSVPPASPRSVPPPVPRSVPPATPRSVPPPVPQSVPPATPRSVPPPIPHMPPAAGAPPPLPGEARGTMPSSPSGGANIVPPIIRIPQGGMLGPSTPSGTMRSGSMLCEILLRNGSATQEKVDEAIAIQEERGGQIGRILISIGACSEDAIARALIEQLRVRKKIGEPADISAAARVNKDVAGLEVLTRPGRTIATLFVTDLVALLLAALLASSVHWLRTYAELGEIDWTSWLVVGPSIALCVLTYLGLELYSPMAKSTPDEIRDIVFATSLVHLGASLLSTLGNLPIVKWGVFVRGVWWMATLFLVPVFRSFVRNKLSTQPWWGIPVCVLGAAKTGRLIVRTLKAQPRSGLKPVMLLDDDPAKIGTLRASFTNEGMDVYSVNVSSAHFMSEAQRKALSDDLFGGGGDSHADDDDDMRGPISSDHIPLPPSSWLPKREASGGVTPEDFLGPDSGKPKSQRPTADASVYPRGKFAEVDGVPVVGDLSLAPVLAQRLKIPYAVVAMPGVDSHKLLQIIERIGGKFSHLLIIPDLFGFATMGVPAKSLGGVLGVEVRQQLLLPGPRLAKRVMDVALTGMGCLFVLPFLLLIAALIKLDSKGPVFYTQLRLGKDGEHFKAYKFRTMHGDGEARLKAILDADPALRAEYEIYHKLRKDPRVTRIGRFLRKFSLDEFPQLLNVIKGDMSLVGPRPYIERELTEMSGQEKIILRAPPGMTGMWQVSDRNATSFAQRCQIDVYYVRNWSPWLDIHILAKTFGVVIKGSGV